MCRSIYTLLALLALTVSSFSAQAQCSSCTITITVPSSSGLSIADNDQVCITGTGTFSGNINMYGENSTLCIGENVIVTGNVGLNDNTLTVTNYGTIDIGSFSMQGTFINNGSFSSTNFQLNSGSTFTNNGSLDVGNIKLNNGSTLNNNGTLASSNFNMNSNSTFNNYNTASDAVLIDGDLSLNSGNFNTAGGIEITGNLEGNGGDFTSTYTGDNAIVIGGDANLNSGNFETTGDMVIDGDVYLSGADLILDGAGMMIGGTFYPYSGSLTGTGSGSGCEGISFGELWEWYDPTDASITNVDVCNSTDPDATDPSQFDSSVTTCNCSTLLPVEFIGYNTTADYDNAQVKVAWSTSSETNSAYFVIEKSSDGYSFEVLGEVTAMGNTESIAYYSFNDTNPTYGKAYYRIKQIDIDGTYAYTDVMVQYYENKVAGAEMFVSASEGTIQLSFNKNVGEGNVEIISVGGQIVFQQSIEVDNYTYSLQPDKPLAAGIYIVKFNSTENYWVKKVKVD
ncbi:MAG: hypothetical protein CMO01_05605 [Thalassobius sp.]|nr:hypothetical protein [Thalassovita sp.]